MWQYAKNLEQLNASMTVKFDDYREGLVVSVPLDEGMGLTTVGRFYTLLPVDTASALQNSSAVNITTVQFLVHSGESPGWAPSGVHMTPLANYSLAFRNTTLEELALKLCYKQFYEGVLQEHCSKVLVSQALFYYESCLADVADSGSLAHYKLSVSLFGFYCHKVLNISECKLFGTYDAFTCPTEIKETKDEDLTPTEIIVISFSSFLFLWFLLLIIIVVCRRKKKRKSRVERIYCEDTNGERSNKYIPGEQADNRHAMRPLKELLDVYVTDSEDEQSPGATPSLPRKPLIRNPAGAVESDKEDEETAV